MLRTVVPIVLAAALAACNPALRPTTPRAAAGAPPAPLDASAATPARTVRATIDNGWVAVTVTIPAEPAGPKPVVIAPIVPDEELLRRGFAIARFHTNWETLRAFAPQAEHDAAVAPAPPVPTPAPTAKPERVGSWLLAAPRPGIVGRAYFGIISMDAERSVPRVVDYLTTLDEVDPRRIAITGSSTSGFVALQALVAEPRLAAAVVRVACGDYHTFLRSSSLALNDDPRWLPGGRLELDTDYAVEIAAREPIRHADRLPPRPLLLLAGETDRAIPYACVQNTVDLFRAAYDDAGVPDRFEFVSYANQGHNLTAPADAEVLAWLERWLASGPDASPPTP
jgi:dienelactone hydrolase